jgi:hypothetical protein
VPVVVHGIAVVVDEIPPVDVVHEPVPVIVDAVPGSLAGTRTFELPVETFHAVSASMSASGVPPVCPVLFIPQSSG